MAKKLHKSSVSAKTAPYLSSTVKDSAQQIWLAGLGAFSKAQEEGTKVFDTLVKQGMAIQRKTQAVAEEKMTEAASRAGSLASDVQPRAGPRWDSLENIFEERVAKALSKLGVPVAQEFNALAERIDQLDHEVRALKAASAPAGMRARPDAPPVAKPRAKAAGKTVAQPNLDVPAAKTATRPAAKRTSAQAARLPADITRHRP